MPTKKHSTSAGGSNTYPADTGRKAQVVEFARDGDDWHTLKDIPIFDGHDGAEDGLPVVFDKAKLIQIVNQCNARIKDTGDLVPVTAGHTSEDPSVPEPEILGYAYRFSLGTIGKVKPRPCILCDMKIRKDRMALVKRLPRRSIELWPDLVIDPVVLSEAEEPAIDSVALLGAQRPARDLGMLFQKNTTTRSRYRHSIDRKELMNPEELIRQCVEAISALPEFAFIRDQMAKAKMEEDGEPLKEEEDGEPASFEDDDNAAKMKARKRMEADEDKAKMEHDEEPLKEEEDCAPAKLRMQRDQERRRYARLESQHKALFAKVERLERDKRLADRKADLLALEGEGYSFDLSDELDYVSDMEPARYSKHLSKIKTRYKKAPIGVNITPARVDAAGGVQPVTMRPEDVYAKTASLYKTGRTIDKLPQEAN